MKLYNSLSAAWLLSCVLAVPIDTNALRQQLAKKAAVAEPLSSENGNNKLVIKEYVKDKRGTKDEENYITNNEIGFHDAGKRDAEVAEDYIAKNQIGKYDASKRDAEVAEDYITNLAIGKYDTSKRGAEVAEDYITNLAIGKYDTSKRGAEVAE